MVEPLFRGLALCHPDPVPKELHAIGQELDTAPGQAELGVKRYLHPAGWATVRSLARP